MTLITEMLAYDFMRYAFIVGSLVALCAALLGVPLVLKRFAMIGDGLSHVAFGTMAIALAFGWTPLYVALPVVALASVGLLHLSDDSEVKGDAAIAMISTCAMAIGVSVISLSKGMNTDVYGYMFGSILAIDKHDLWLSVILAAIVIGLYIVSFHYLFAITFDEPFAHASGVPVRRYRLLLSLLTAVTIVLGLRLVGALLISGLVIFPASTGMRLAKTFRGVVLVAAATAIIAMTVGLTLSYLYNLPAGATVVLLNLALFLTGTFAARFCKR